MADTELTMPCRECGTFNPSVARFCNGCGARLAVEPPAPAPEPVDPLIGTLIDGRFRVIERLGAGGMGVVYRGEQVSVGRSVALKLLTPRTGTDPRLCDRFRNEAMLSSRLNHPNTVIIYDFGVTESGSLFLAMELIAGTSLDDELNRMGLLAFERARHIALQICDSLYDAHQNSIVHRDLKPDNVMLTHIGTKSDVVKVLDFGIAKILDPSQSERVSHLTAPNEVFGTPEYMSPEQVSANPMDHRTDIYALGVMLYRMVSGKLPFLGETPIATLAKHLGEPIPSVAATAAAAGIHLPVGTEELITSMLAKKADERPLDMGEVARRLKSLGRPILASGVAPAAAPMVSLELSAPTPSLAVADPSLRIAALPQAPRVEDVRPPQNPEPDVAPSSSAGREDVSEAALPAPRPLVPMPTAAYEPQEGETRKQTTLRVLVERMRKRPDFPVISQNLSELNTKAGMSSTSAADLANVILKDLSLTTKLLRLVNSPYYGQVRGKVNAVSRAVVLIGFDMVRQSVLGLMLFDHLQRSNPELADELRDGAIESLTTGILGKIAAGRDPQVNPEDVFVAGLLKDLGRQLALFYFSKEMKAVRATAAANQISEVEAFSRQLGVTFDELGAEVATLWGFPEKLRLAIGTLPPGTVEKAKTAPQRVQQLSAFGGELAAAAGLAGPERKRAFGRLIDRFGGVLKLTEEDLEAFIAEGLDVLEHYTKLLDLPVRGSNFLRNMLDGSGRSQGADKSAPGEGGVAAMLAALDESAVVAPPLSDEDFAERQQILSVSALDVAEHVKRGKFELNDLMLAVLEAMYRGLGLNRVSFMFHDVRTKSMRARSGFGPSIEALLPDFHFKIDGRMDHFNKALSTGQDIIVNDSRDPRSAPYVPPWYRKLLDAPMYLLLPVRIKSFPAALFYGDFSDANHPIDKRLMEELTNLRGHAAAAIRDSQR